MSEESARLVRAFYADGPKRLESGPFLSSAITDAFVDYRHMFPELVSYRGGLFVEANFDKTTVDDVFDMAEFGDDLSAVANAEMQINALGLFAEAAEPGDVAAAKAAAEGIGWVWRRWVSETYGVDIEVVASIGDEDSYVTFRSVPAT